MHIKGLLRETTALSISKLMLTLAAEELISVFQHSPHPLLKHQKYQSCILILHFWHLVILISRGQPCILRKTNPLSIKCHPPGSRCLTTPEPSPPLALFIALSK